MKRFFSIKLQLLYPIGLILGILFILNVFNKLKKNCWAACVGGVLFFLGGYIKLLFFWNIWHVALLQGLKLARQQGINSFSILEDSKVINNQMKKKALPKDMKLAIIFWQIYFVLEAFHTFVPRHISTTITP